MKPVGFFGPTAPRWVHSTGFEASGAGAGESRRDGGKSAYLGPGSRTGQDSRDPVGFPALLSFLPPFLLRGGLGLHRRCGGGEWGAVGGNYSPCAQTVGVAWCLQGWLKSWGTLSECETSLVAQWLRIRLPMQGTWV